MGDGPVTRHARAWLPVLLPLLVLSVLYARTLDYPFVNYDDDLHVRRNQAVMAPQKLSLGDQLYPRTLGYPMPLTMLSYRFDAARTGATQLRPDQARAFHQTNLLIAALLVLAAFGAARQLLSSPLAAAVVVGAWLLHPITVEPIAWISGRKDLLMATLALSALWAALAYLERPSRWRLLAVTLSTMASIAAKPTGVFMVPMLWYLGLFSLRGRDLSTQPRRELLAASGLLTLIAAAAMIVAWRGNLAVGGAGHAAGLLDSAQRVLGALGVSTRLITLPVGLGPRYIFAGDLPTMGYLALALLPLGLAGVLLWRGGRRAGPLAIAAFLGAASYAPSSNLIPLTRFVADSYLLLPTFALLVGIAAALLPWLAGRPRRSLALLAVGALLAMGASALTWVQVEQWSSSVRLWRSMVARYPNSPQVCRMLAHGHTTQRQFAEAITLGERCARRFGPALFAKNIAISYLLTGRRERAWHWFTVAAREHPHDLVVRKYLRQLGKR